MLKIPQLLLVFHTASVPVFSNCTASALLPDSGRLNTNLSNYSCSIIVDKIDSNNDSFVDLSELKKWIQFTQRRYIDEDVDRQWRQHNKNNEDFVQWEVSKKWGRTKRK